MLPNNQINMDDIVQKCQAMLSGSKLQPKQQQNLRNFMLQLSNVEIILHAGIKELSVLICFKMFTTQVRRNGTYFDTKNNGVKIIVLMMKMLADPPSYPTQHQCNVYLSLQGQLLGALISYSDQNQLVSQFLYSIWTRDVYLEIKIHFMLKIIVACFQEIIEIRHTNNDYKLRHVMNLIHKHGQLFSQYIGLIAQLIENNFDEFNNVFNAIQNLQHVQESFLKAMDQYEEDSQFQLEFRRKKQIPQWECCLIIKLSRISCVYITKILQIFKIPDFTNRQNLYQKALSVFCRCVTLLTYFWTLIHNQRESKYYKQLNQIISKNFICQFLKQLYYFKGFTKPLLQLSSFQCIFHVKVIINLSAQCHSAVLKLCTTNSQIFQQILKSNQQSNLNFQPMFQMALQLKKYCMLMIQNFYFYFSDFQQCPIGLSIKMMSMIKQIGIKILIKGQASESLIQDVKSHFQKMYQLFFEYFIMTKMTSKLEVMQQDNQFFVQGKDWQDFISNNLNSYFDQLVLYAPRYFYHLDIASQSQQLQDFQSFLAIKYQKDERGIGKKMQMLQHFKKDKGFNVMWRMLSSITSLKCQFQQNFVHKQQGMSQQQQNSQLSVQILQQLLFVNMMPILSCFRALIQTALDSEVKSFFFHQYYLIAKQIQIDNYGFCQDKAKLAKLYVYDVFFDEILPQSFALQGENASSILIFISKYFAQDLNGIIDQIMQQIKYCLYSFDSSQPQEQQIAIYALSIVQRVAERISQRIYYLQQQNQYLNKKIIQDFNQKLSYLFTVLKQLQIDSPSVQRRLFMIAGYFIDLNGISCLYQFHQKIQEQTLNPQISVNLTFQRAMEIYLAGINGILLGIKKPELFRYAVELVLKDLTDLKKNENFKITNKLTQVYLYFLDSLANGPKLQQKLHTDIKLQVCDIFAQDLPIISKQVIGCPDLQKLLGNLYEKMARINIDFQLYPIPFKIDKKKHYQLLQQYFNGITRLKDISILQPFIIYKMRWLISFLQAKIQRDERISIQQLDLQNALFYLRFQKSIKIQQLATLISITSQIDAKDVLIILKSGFDKIGLPNPLDNYI